MPHNTYIESFDMEPSNGRHTHAEPVTHAALDDIDSTTTSAGGHADGNSEGSFPALTANNVAHQRRRVNPESLALRLGPDLVRDLDALITPGNKEMPSFAVRKELQERYNIDRRHIYDYFHSRGLRVVKEDKHGNPTVAGDLPTPLPNLRPLRQLPVKHSHSHPSYPVAVAERKLFRPRGITKAKPGRPRKNPSSPKVALRNEPTNVHAPAAEHSPDTVPFTYVSVNPLLPHSPHSPVTASEDRDHTFNSVVNPLDESFSVRRAIGDIAYAYRHRLVFERMQELVEHSVKLALVDDRLVSWNETSPCSASSKGLLLPHAKSLTWDERRAIYDMLSESLGSAHGIQECQGTYRKYMEARSKVYFEGLVSVPYHHPQQPDRTNTLLDRKSPLGTNEFRHWLSETRFLKRDGINGSPRPLPSHRNVNVAKQVAESVADERFRHKSRPHWVQTLDDLFPTSGDTLSNYDPITDSPVVHTQVTRITVHARGATEGYSAGDQLLFSAASGPSSPGPPVTSTGEFRQTGRTQFHGLPGLPAPQEVRTRMPPAETDHQPQWLEHVPYIAASGRGASPGETLRGRDVSSNTRGRHPPSSPWKPQVRDLDRILTRPVTSRDARRRTPSAAGNI